MPSKRIRSGPLKGTLISWGEDTPPEATKVSDMLAIEPQFVSSQEQWKAVAEYRAQASAERIRYRAAWAAQNKERVERREQKRRERREQYWLQRAFSERDQAIVRLRCAGMTYKQIANQFDIGAARVVQIVRIAQFVQKFRDERLPPPSHIVDPDGMPPLFYMEWTPEMQAQEFGLI